MPMKMSLIWSRTLYIGCLCPSVLVSPGRRDVNGLTLKLQLHELGAKLGLALLDGGLNVAAQLVCQLTHDGALLGGKLAHLRAGCR